MFCLKILCRSSQGKDWYDFRTKVNQHMMQPRVINPHIGQMTEIAVEFIQKIREELRDPITLELPATFNNEMNKWALECRYFIISIRIL